MTKTRAFIKGNFSRRQHKKLFSVGNLLILGTLSMNEDTEKDKNKKDHYKCLYIYIWTLSLSRTAGKERFVLIRILYCIFKFLNPCNQKVYTPVSIFKLIWENEKNVILRFKKLMFFPNGLSLEYEIYHFWDRLDVAYPYMI